MRCGDETFNPSRSPSSSPFLPGQLGASSTAEPAMELQGTSSSSWVRPSRRRTPLGREPRGRRRGSGKGGEGGRRWAGGEVGGGQRTDNRRERISVDKRDRHGKREEGRAASNRDSLPHEPLLALLVRADVGLFAGVDASMSVQIVLRSDQRGGRQSRPVFSSFRSTLTRRRLTFLKNLSSQKSHLNGLSCSFSPPAVYPPSPAWATEPGSPSSSLSGDATTADPPAVFFPLYG